MILIIHNIPEIVNDFELHIKATTIFAKKENREILCCRKGDSSTNCMA